MNATNVFSITGLMDALLTYKINFSIRDLLNQDKVDILLTELAEKVCNSKNWIGAGIGRSCFYLNDRLVLKVDKEFYVDENDKRAAEDYCDREGLSYDYWAESYLDYVSPEEYSYNYVSSAGKSSYQSEQSKAEVEFFRSALFDYLNGDSDDYDYIAHTVASTNNYNISICENCPTDYYYNSIADSDEEIDRRYREIMNRFEDVHDDNVGLNKNGKIVCIDLGFCY